MLSQFARLDSSSLLFLSDLGIGKTSYARSLAWKPKRNGRAGLAVLARSTATSYRQDRLKKLSELAEDVIRTAINTGPRGVIRVAQGFEAVVSVGTEWLLEQTRNLSTVNNSRRDLQIGLPGPVQLRKLFERMGATYIKLGQFIASTPTLFPRDYVEEFQNCLDKTPGVPYSEIRAVIQEELGHPLDEIYEYIDPQPIASASIAQVHAARLKGSLKEVVIKVLKPAVEDILTADLNFLYIAASIMEFLNPQLSRASFVSIVGDIRDSMLDEVDFRKEAINIEAFNNYLEVMALRSQATAPQVYRHCSTQRVLTMERLYGVPLTDLKSIRSLVASPEATLISALNVWFGSLVACDTFHADVHAGNLLVLQDGRVGFIDFGIVGRISSATWVAIETFLSSISCGQYNAMAAALVQMGAADTEVNIGNFAKDLEKIFSAFQDLDSEILVTAAGRARGTTIAATLSVDERQLNALLLDVINVSETYGIRFPREFGILMKQLLYFDRYTRLLAPNLKVLEDDRIAIRHYHKNGHGNNGRGGPIF